MKKKWMALILLMGILLGGCRDNTADPEEVLQALLKNVTYATELTEVKGTVYFPELPAGTAVRLFAGNGYYADEVVILTPSRASERNRVLEAVDRHIGELRSQFLNYVPDEVQKIDDAFVFERGGSIFLCITADTSGARRASQSPASVSEAESAAASAETSAPVPQPAPVTYPVLKSKSGTFYDYGNGVIRVDDRAYERYSYGGCRTYTALVNKTAAELRGLTQVYALPIPTAIGVVLPDDVAGILPGYTDQGRAVEDILEHFSPEVQGVSCFENLMQHRDEYLYFRTDYHWNGRGAYYAYESFCRAAGLEPIRLEQRKSVEFPGFMGALYGNSSGKDPVLAEKPDTVQAFYPASHSAAMQFTDKNGKTFDWNIIMDVSSWNPASKYSTFAGADNPIAVFRNPEAAEDTVLIVVKESYGNALLPYLTDHYRTIYEIDYRYWQGNLTEFAKEKEADALLFANNLTMIGSGFLLGKLSDIIS